MIYPADFENKIGFSVIRTMLSGKCLSEMGRRHCASMAMVTDRTRLIAMLCRTEEMRKIMASAVQLPLEAVEDPSGSIAVLKAKGGHISAGKFASLSKFMATAERLAGFFSQEADGAAGRPELTRRFRNMPALTEPQAAVNAVVTHYGHVRDNASPELADIRRRINAAEAAINGLLRRVMDKAVQQGLVSPDATPSVRDGHLVIPVAAANKKSVPGIVYDQSATGKTYFIEPVQVVEANNNLKALQLDERKEIIEILTRLSAELLPCVPDMEEAAAQIGLVDFIRAKALLAIQLDGQLPSISRQPEIDWFHAVHPVLFLSLKKQGREVVPLKLKLDGNTRIVVISGPNAGGKSVCLKTIAIVQYMMQCGLLPTLHSNSHMGVFTKLLIDIGDEQSIENDLSTYSSHLRNMRVFLTQAGPDTLFLADEMGSGTEPQIGGAIAQAILQKLNGDKAFGVVTTHYQNLKTFANESSGLVNAAMLYDRQNLQPLFQLSVGTPGSSFALDIARKSGIPKDVIDNAKDIAGSDYVNIDKYLLDLARDKKYWADKRMTIREKERNIDRMTEALQSKADEIKQRKADIIHQAREQARLLMDGANAKIENAIRQIRVAEAEKEKTRLVRKELDDYRRKVMNGNDEGNNAAHDKILRIPGRKNKNKNKISSVGTDSREQKDTRPLAAGDYVKIPSSSLPGKILSISGNKAEVAMGGLRTFIPLADISLAKPPVEQRAGSSISVSTSEDSRRRQLDFHNEIDVRGFRVDEALQAVTYFIDDAIQFQASRVRILHGTGTGALRMAIRSMLQANNAVESFHDEDVRLGGAGITVVNLI